MSTEGPSTYSSKGDDNAKLGSNERRSGLPFMSDDAGTPFAVTIVSMDKAFAVRAK